MALTLNQMIGLRTRRSVRSFAPELLEWPHSTTASCPVGREWRGTKEGRNVFWISALLFLAAAGTGFSQFQSYTIELNPGFNSIANHLDGRGNWLDEIFLEVPDGAQLYKFDPGTGEFTDPAEYSLEFGWFWPDPFVGTLSPGEGAFMQVPAAGSLLVTGEPHLPQRRTDVQPGLNFVSCQTTQTCGFPELFGFGPIPGDVVYKFDRPFPQLSLSLDQIASSIHRFGNQGWDETPAFTMGKSAFVFLSGSPRITLQPTNQSVLAGADAALVADAMGSLPLYFQWRFRGVRLPGQNSSTLILGSLSASDSGFYSLVISNAVGSVTSAPVRLRILLPPTLQQQPQSVTAIFGEPVAFAVAASGTPPLQYRWSLNGADIPGATDPVLEISAVSPSDAGRYVVVVSNPYGTVSSDAAILAVNVPPMIIAQPTSQTAGSGSTVLFSVTAVGTEPLAYQWRLNGANIPDATNATLTLTGVQPADSGSYQVTVANVAGAVDSLQALLRVSIPNLPLMDDFATAVVMGNPSRVGRSSNVGGTREPGEPNHAGKIGGASSWITWISPDTGIVTFNTGGSSIDTLLAAYTGSTPSNLIEVASDDDSGGYFASALAFNAVAGAEYHIAVDGFNGALGDIVLGWDLERTADSLPVIVAQPESQTAAPGDDVTFTVAATGIGLNYQWFVGDEELSGATSPTLTLINLTESNLGDYFVRVFAGTRFIDSRHAMLQFSLAGPEGQVQDIFAADKFGDVVIRIDPSPSPRFRVPAPRSGSLVLGYTGSQTFSTAGATRDEDEPNHCGIPGGASHWFSYIPPASGELYLDTEGSNFDTVLAVYTGPGPTYASLTAVACDNNSGANGLTSKLDFPATGGNIYYIVVDGVNAATGIVQLHYRLLVPMLLTNPAKTNSFRFRVTATPSLNFTIERSLDLVHWLPLLTTNSATGVFDFLDTNTPPTGKRFYRTAQTP